MTPAMGDWNIKISAGLNTAGAAGWAFELYDGAGYATVGSESTLDALADTVAAAIRNHRRNHDRDGRARAGVA